MYYFYGLIEELPAAAVAVPFTQVNAIASVRLPKSTDAWITTQRNKLLLDADQLMPQIWM